MNPIRAFFYFPFTPRRVARQFEHTALWKVYLLHWLGLLLLAAVVVAIDALWSTLLRPPPLLGPQALPLPPPGPPIRVLPPLLPDEFDPVGIALTLLIGETVSVAVASIMVCWAGRSESLSASWLHSLRVSWLYASHLPWIVIVIGLAAFLIAAWNAWNASSLILVVLGGSTIVASIVSYLKALSGRPPVDTLADDPMCEWCGYNIGHADPQGLCPECGRPIAASLSPIARRDLHAASHTSDHAWAGPYVAAWTSPEQLFRSLVALAIPRQAVHGFILALSATTLASGYTFVSVLIYKQGVPVPGQRLMIPSVLLMIGFFAAWCFFMAASAAATLAGLLASRRSGRNRMQAALTVVALTSGLFPIWAALGIGAMMLMATYRLSPAWFIGWWLVNGLGAIAYFAAVNRRMAYVQYANR